MALDIWFRDDLAQGIIAVTVAMLSASAASGANLEYCRGVIDTARAQALNYGIPWPDVTSGLREVLGDGRGELLELLGLVAIELPGGKR